MNLKIFALSIVAATGIVSGSFLVSAPVKATTIVDGDTLAFSGFSRFNRNGNTGYLDFAEGSKFETPTSTGIGTASVVQGSTGAAFEPLVNTTVVLKDLTLLKAPGVDSWMLGSEVSNFLTLANGITFRLDTFVLNKEAKDWIADYTGVFFGDNTISARGGFDPLDDKNFVKLKGSFYIADATAVPTPALLPGLLGMGIAALRQRARNEEGTEENA